MDDDEGARELTAILLERATDRHVGERQVLYIEDKEDDYGMLRR